MITRIFLLGQPFDASFAVEAAHDDVVAEMERASTEGRWPQFSYCGSTIAVNPANVGAVADAVGDRSDDAPPGWGRKGDA